MNGARNMIDYEVRGLDARRARLEPSLPAGIRLRPADLAADLQALNELCQAAFGRLATSVWSGDGAVSSAEVTDLLRHPGLVPPGVFIALDGELPVGMVVGRIEVPAAGEVMRRAAVELLAVRPGYRRRGIARALLVRVLAWLLEGGVDVVVASTDNPVVGALLESLGFRVSTAV